MDSVVAAEYELEYLLLEGHCYDITTGQPPRGLQFTLGTSANPVIVDTIVMANLVNNQYIRWEYWVMLIWALEFMDKAVCILNMSEIKIHDWINLISIKI